MVGDTPDGPTEALVRDEGARLFGLAYRMLGSAAEAEDAVQEAYVRWARTDQATVAQPPAWLTTTLTRICVDRLRSAQHRREAYVGQWLPEPIATDADPADVAGIADSLTFAFLVMLESLSPLERAAFLLHDVFGHDFAEVARMLERSPAAVRQLASRARTHVAQRTTRQRADREQARVVTDAFLAACAGDDLDAIMGLLAPDVVFVGDGGGLAYATPAPVRGQERVARLVRGLWRVGMRDGLSVDLVEVNTEPGLWVRAGTTTASVLVVEVADGLICAIRGVRNPEKLVGFGDRVRSARKPS
ncbi:MAG TPA: RNA polymerase sigma factor SigJ [Euzebya sp.]|nr:RNA polymerase sigma factor SigJ [Euzebya sp.]